MLRGLVVILVACLAITSRATAGPTLINFDNLPASTAYSQGNFVPVADRLSNQLQSTSGILFSSNSPYVAVVVLNGNSAPSLPNAIAGTSAAGTIDYSAQVTFSFWN